MTTRIITNHHWRDFILGADLPEFARADFDYLTDDEFPSHEFIKYRGVYYDDSEFMDCGLDYWHAVSLERTVVLIPEALSGVVIRYSDDGDQYQVGLALS